MALTPTQVPTLVDLAVRHALRPAHVSHLTFPNDLQIAAAEVEPLGRSGPAGAADRAGVSATAGAAA